MIKKIFLTLVLCCMIISCGKKGDPVYKSSDKKNSKQSIFLNKS